jgi:multiple antibiotic resistance protein
MGVVDYAFGVAVILSLVAIIDPPGVIAPFLVLTEGFTPQEKRQVITKSCVVAAVTLAVFAVFGQWIFAVFNFTIPAFKIAGGILLFATAFQMTQGQRTSRTRITERGREEEVEALGVVPLGIPLLAGPGAITTVLVYMTKETGDPLDKMFVFVGILAAVLITFTLLNSADRVFRRVGRTGTIAFGRIMGIVLAAVGVQFVLDGILQVVSGLR